MFKERVQTLDLATQYSRLDFVVWDYITTGNGQELNDNEIGFIYESAKYTLEYQEAARQAVESGYGDQPLVPIGDPYKAVSEQKQILKDLSYSSKDIIALIKRADHLVELAQGKKIIESEITLDK